jgi:uncharacterized protein
VRSLVSDDVTYVSLNYGQSGTASDRALGRQWPGAQRIVQTFVDVERFWKKVDFRAEALFGSGEYAAVFRRFTHRSRVVGKLVTNGRCICLELMEDTFASSVSFRSGGAWTFGSDPAGKEVTI